MNSMSSGPRGIFDYTVPVSGQKPQEKSWLDTGLSFISNRVIQSIASSVLSADPKVLAENQAALKAITGDESLVKLVKFLISTGLTTLTEDPAFKKIAAESSGLIETIESTVETVLTSAIANLAKAVQAKAAKSKEIAADSKELSSSLKPNGKSEKLTLDMLSYFSDIAEKHFTGQDNPPRPNAGFKERIIAIETAHIPQAQKDKEIEAIFAPLMKDLYSALFPECLIKAAGLGSSAKIISWLCEKKGYPLDKMLQNPALLVKLYRTLMGYEAEQRKQTLMYSLDGQLLLAGVNIATEQLRDPLLKAAIGMIFDGTNAAISSHPLLKQVGAFGSYMAESFVTKIVMKLGGNDDVNPLQSVLTRLKGIFGKFYADHHIKLKKNSDAHLALKNELQEFTKIQDKYSKNDPLKIAYIKELNEKIKANKQERINLFYNVSQSLWGALDLANEPPIHLFAEKIRVQLPEGLCTAFDKAIEHFPGIVAWLSPEQENKSAQEQLAKLPNGTDCNPVADVISDILVTPLLKLLTDKKLDVPGTSVEAINKIMVDNKIPALPDHLKKHMASFIGNKFQAISEQDQSTEFWKFAKLHIHTAFADVLQKMGFDNKKIDNPIAAVASGFQDILVAFEKEKGALVDKNRVELEHAKNAYQEARNSVENGLKEVLKPELIEPIEKQCLALKAAYEKQQNAFDALFEPLLTKILEASGTNKFLEKGGKLCILGLEVVIKQALAKLLGNGYQNLLKPLIKQEEVRHELAKNLHDQNHAQELLKGNDEAAQTLRKLGTDLHGKGQDAQHAIIVAAGTDKIVDGLEKGRDLFSEFIESQLITFLSTKGLMIAKLIHKDVLKSDPRLNEPALKILGGAIKKLAENQQPGVQGVFKYLHKALAPALSKALTALVKNTPSAFAAAPKAHAKELVPLDVVARLLELMHARIDALEKEPAFQTLREEMWDLEDQIKQKQAQLPPQANSNPPGGIPTSPSSAGRLYDAQQAAKELDQKHGAASDMDRKHAHAAVLAPLSVLENEIQQLKTQLETLQTQLSEKFRSTAQTILNMTVDGDPSINNPSHPMNDVAIIPQYLRQQLWDTVIPDCLSQIMASHYHKMQPNVKALEQNITAATGTKDVVELLQALGIVIRDCTPDALAKNPKKLTDELMPKLLAKLTADKSPEAAKNLGSLLKEKEALITSVITKLISTLGTSKHAALVEKLWPALQRLSYPLLLSFTSKGIEALKKFDTAENRITLAYKLLKVISGHVNNANEGACDMGYSHPRDVPDQEMLDDQRARGNLHEVMDKVLRSPADQEDKILLEAFGVYAKQLFSNMKFTKDDLFCEENEQDALFTLIQDTLAPLTLSLMTQLFVPGSLRAPIDGNMLHMMEISLLHALEAKINADKEQAKLDYEHAMRAENLGRPAPEAPIIPVRVMTPEMKRLAEEIGNWLKAMINRIPDPIVRQKFMGSLMDSSAQDLGCKLLDLLEQKKIMDFVPFLAKLSKDSLGIDASGFHPKAPTPKEIRDNAKKARTMFTNIFSEIIISSIQQWFDGVGKAVENWIDAICKFFDKDKSVRSAQPIGNVIKKILRWIGRGLAFLAIPFVWLAKQFIRWRVAVASDNLHGELVKAFNRDPVFKIWDIIVGRDGSEQSLFPNDAALAKRAHILHEDALKNVGNLWNIGQAAQKFAENVASASAAE